jgi:hypothetical protein
MKTWKNKNNKILLAYSPKIKLISILHLKVERKNLQKSKVYWFKK